MPTDTAIDYAELLQLLQTTPGDVTDEQLGDADQALVARLEELRPAIADGTITQDQLDEVIRLGEQLDAVRTASSEREQAATDRATRAQAVLDRAAPAQTDSDAPADGDGEPTDGAADADTTDGDADQGADTADQPEPVAAGGARRRPAPGQLGRPASAPRRPATERARVTMAVAADVAGFAAGQTIGREDIGQAMAARLHSIRSVRGGSGENVPVMTFTAEIPDGRMLYDGRVGENTRRLDQLSGPQAITAAGVCAPFEVDYSIDVVGDTDEPIKASLPQFGAARGGVQARRDIDAGGAGPVSATGQWSLADDAAVGSGDPPDPKVIWDVPCYPVIQEEVTAYTLSLRFSTTSDRFDPESGEASARAALIAHARYMENIRLGRLLNGSKRLTATDQISAVVDLLVSIDKITAYLRWRRRLNAAARLRMYLPIWVRDMIRADLTRGMRTASLEALAVADATVDQWFSNRGINITWHLDGLPASTTPAVPLQGYADAAPGSVVPGFPDIVDIVVFPEGSWKLLDGGTLDLGVVRDAELVRTNRYMTFTESWEGMLLKGIESLRISHSLQPTGMSAGTLDTSALTD